MSEGRPASLGSVSRADDNPMLDSPVLDGPLIDSPLLDSPVIDVALRPFEAGDCAAVATWVGDIEVGLAADEWLDAVLAEAQPDAVDGRRSRFTFAIIAAESVVGAVLLSIDSWADRRAEIGFVVGAPWRRRGIAYRSIDLLVRHAFDEVGLHRLWAACDPENAPARAVLIRNGFTVEGRLVHDRRVTKAGADVWRDSLILGRIADG